MNNIIKPKKKILDRRETGQLGCRTARIQDSLDTEQLRFRKAGRTGRMQNRKIAVQKECRAVGIQDRCDAGK